MVSNLDLHCTMSDSDPKANNLPLQVMRPSQSTCSATGYGSWLSAWLVLVHTQLRCLWSPPWPGTHCQSQRTATWSCAMLLTPPTKAAARVEVVAEKAASSVGKKHQHVVALSMVALSMLDCGQPRAVSQQRLAVLLCHVVVAVTCPRWPTVNFQSPVKKPYLVKLAWLSASKGESTAVTTRLRLSHLGVCVIQQAVSAALHLISFLKAFPRRF